jgi:hypothetical protein
MIMSVAAFLILWYFWVKRRLNDILSLDDEQEVLFPFRYFSWLFLALVVITCLVQVHFLRVSSLVHESLGSMGSFYKDQKSCASGMDELKIMLQNVLINVNAGFRRLAAQTAQQQVQREILGSARASAELGREEWDSPSGGTVQTTRGAASRSGFEKEAQAFGVPRSAKDLSIPPKRTQETGGKVWSMNLALAGRVTAETLRVRRFPDSEAEVIEKIQSGAEVKVTEKRITESGVWFRVITSSGRAGWVDFRYLKLYESPGRAAGM